MTDYIVNLKSLKELAPLGPRFQKHLPFISKHIQQLKIPLEARILDIGTGNGQMSIILASLGYYVITGEPAEHQWGNWKENAQKVGVIDQIRFIPFDAKELPFEHQEFDAIFALGSFHHIIESARETVMQELYRVLSPKRNCKYQKT